MSINVRWQSMHSSISLLLALALCAGAQYSQYTYYASSDCSGNAAYVVGDMESCSSASCTSSSDGPYNSYIVTCPSSVPSPQSGYALEQGWYEEGICPANASYYYAFETDSCVYQEDEDSYVKITCSGTTATQLMCGNASCTDCATFPYTLGMCTDGFLITGCVPGTTTGSASTCTGCSSGYRLEPLGALAVLFAIFAF